MTDADHDVTSADSGAAAKQTEAERRAQALAAQTEKVPSVIVDNVSITYKVLGGGKATPSAASDDGFTVLRRVLARSRGHVGGVRLVEAVRGVTFTAYHGEAIGLVGRNGSGKSTLLRAVAGLIPPTTGTVYVSGEPALLGVNAALINELSGERNVVLGLLAMGMDPKEIQAKYDDIIEFSGIGEFASLPMNAYSSGMAARLRFAISASASPDVLMIDEALATGDADFREKSSERVREIRQRAGTIFLVSHSVSTVKQMCTRAIWLDKGQMLMDGSADEVCSAYQEAVYAGSKKGKAAAAAAAKSAAASSATPPSSS